ncbi:MAG: AAA family ATPase, partial [Deltaproteobacteria bacterium]|nr:AAA family ATPase [Deltaproteobacteria bacterium]
MRILEFRIIAYGPFTDKVIELSGGKQGFHVIYGLNEAGKSSALRALRNLFYGIPERSTDDFLHPYGKMRIGAAIQSGKGDVLEFVRRKGRRNTLRSGDDKTVIEESLLNKFLNGVDADLFVTLFGIDHADLVRGGKEIIRGAGSMGQVIFAAGSGTSNLRELQEHLKSQADGLFTPSASKKKINEAIGKINKNRKELRDAQLPGQQWAAHDQALNHALARKQIVETDLAKKRRALHRFERIQEALPVIAKRKERLNEFRTYAIAVRLPQGFRDQRADFLQTLRVSENDRDQARNSTKALQKELSKLQISESLLENSTVIEEIHREFGSQHKAAG